MVLMCNSRPAGEDNTPQGPSPSAMMAWDLCAGQPRACPDPAAHQSREGWERKVGSSAWRVQGSKHRG